MQNWKKWLSSGFLGLLFGCMLLAILAIGYSEIWEFRQDGLPANARVVNSYKQSSRSSSTGNSTTEYILEVTFMNRADGEPEPSANVDVLAGEFELPAIDVGQFQRAKVKVRRSSFREIAVGDTVELLYLPSDPAEAMLAGEVADYWPIGLWVLSAAALLTTIVSWGGAVVVWAKNRSRQ